MPGKRFKYSAIETEDGDSARVKRLFPGQSMMNYDPFVLLDEFFVDSTSGFPTHPHRGFEAITYVLEGAFRHQDNLGNDTTVTEGGIQRFTAGRGLSHSEMPAAEGITHGFQLWINLPKRLKQIDPDYQQVNASEIPEVQENGLIIRTIVGENSPVRLQTPIQYQHVSINEGKSYSIKLSSGHSGFIYLSDGLLDIDETILQPGEALFLQDEDPLNIMGNKASQFIFLSGTPHGEPIKQWGPYVD